MGCIKINENLSRLSKSCLVPWQDFELVPLSLCPRTRKEFLSLCPEKLHCPVLLETLLGGDIKTVTPIENKELELVETILLYK